MHFYMHSYLHKNFILVKSGCYTIVDGSSNGPLMLDCPSLLWALTTITRVPRAA
jgi:hypothetical protein